MASALVRLRDIRQTLSAGIVGACVQFRTLDGISLDVFPRQLLVLVGDPASGTDALLDVLNGDRRGVTGSRTVAPTACIQRARIAPAQAAAILSAWPAWHRGSRRTQARTPLRVAEGAPVPLVLLELVQPASPTRELVDGVLLRAHAPVHFWVQSLVQRGGAAVLSAGMTLSSDHTKSGGNEIRFIRMARGRILSPPASARCRATFHSRSRHSGRRSEDPHSARACQSFVSTTRSPDG